MDARSAALSALAQFQVTETTVGEALHRIADITLESIPAADIVGMSMLDADGRAATAVYTDAESPAIDEAQYREGKGPCLDAWRNNKVYRVPQIAAASAEYPAFTASCQEHGIQSTLSVPMQAGDVALGAMNLYARVVDGFDDDDESFSRDLAAAAAAVLGNVSAYWAAFDLGVQLNDAMKSRAVIEQAKGMLMATSRGLSPDEAFDMLVSASKRENLKLRDIAQRIVEGSMSAHLRDEP